MTTNETLQPGDKGYKPRWCKKKLHDMNVTGQNSWNQACKECYRKYDKKRAPAKVQRRRFGSEVERFPQGLGWQADRKGFRWSAESVETSGRLRALLEHSLRSGTPHEKLFTWTLDYIEAYNVDTYKKHLLVVGTAPGYALREDVRLLRNEQDDSPIWMTEDMAVRAESNWGEVEWHLDTSTGELFVSYVFEGEPRKPGSYTQEEYDAEVASK